MYRTRLSRSRDFATMYMPMFCGDRSARTILSVVGVKGVRISVFSESASEDEVLFPPLRRFEVRIPFCHTGQATL